MDEAEVKSRNQLPSTQKYSLHSRNRHQIVQQYHINPRTSYAIPRTATRPHEEFFVAHELHDQDKIFKGIRNIRTFHQTFESNQLLNPVKADRPE